MFRYVRTAYNVPAEYGRRVTAYGKAGVIVEDMGNYIGITLDTDKPTVIRPHHPVDGIVYHDEIVKPRKMTRSQKRYREFLNSETSLTFAEWIGATK